MNGQIFKTIVNEEDAETSTKNNNAIMLNETMHSSFYEDNSDKYERVCK